MDPKRQRQFNGESTFVFGHKELDMTEQLSLLHFKVKP